jgi:hypothetical protein
MSPQPECPGFWKCPNRKPVGDDTDMQMEHYECKECGKRDYLDYEEMR